MRIDMLVNTSGRGLYSREQKPVRIIKLELTNVDEDTGTGELRARFDKRSWKTGRDGLIYTDQKFLRELREELKSLGLPGAGVAYSEQGMQGDDYVSLDASKQFVNRWSERYPLARPR